MACSSDVVKKKVMRFKLQLTGAAESATVLKILQKLKDLDITLDILAETGIGKTVNSLRRHEQAGEFAKSLVKGWKSLVPKQSTSHTDTGDAAESLIIKDEPGKQNCPNNGRLTTEDLNNNVFTNQNSSDAALFPTEHRKADSENKKIHQEWTENQEKSTKEISISQNEKKIEIREDKIRTKEKKNDEADRKSREAERSDSRETVKRNCEGERLMSEIKKSKTSKESFLFKSSNKLSKTFKLDSIKNDTSSGISSSDSQNRKQSGKKKHDRESENPKNKMVKTKHKAKERNDDDPEEPSVSFESCLNYDVNVFKRKERNVVKKAPKKMKTAVKEATHDPGMKPLKSSELSINVTSPKRHFKESVMDLMNIPLPAFLPECEKPSSFEYYERKVEKESDSCDASKESTVFTGQRLNKKMQVYSGAKTVFLPAMMSLHQQCIRTLQNNINLLYETGGVPFEILEPVLERCTPEQLLRIEECNPIYVGVTDHLWGKHCQRDFKDSKLQEYESWKEMYIRLSEERERKFQRLTKSIVSAHSSKPKGRQVKMAFIHTVAKPPRDVRIQQEIYGTAVQQPHQPRRSVKVQDNKTSQSCNEPSRASSIISGAGNTQDPRKKTRVAPMMAKSLKAFKKQLGRR